MQYKRNSRGEALKATYALLAIHCFGWAGEGDSAQPENRSETAKSGSSLNAQSDQYTPKRKEKSIANQKERT